MRHVTSCVSSGQRMGTDAELFSGAVHVPIFLGRVWGPAYAVNSLVQKGGEEPK